jgi:hypothetical protein
MSEQLRRNARIGVIAVAGVMAAIVPYCFLAALVGRCLQSRRLFGRPLPLFCHRILEYSYENVDQLLSVLALASAAFCVWLMVRIVNRRERWAKWTLAATLALPVLYVASFGPACWIMASASEDDPYHESLIGTVFDFTYWPIGRCADEQVWQIDTAVVWYGELGMPKGTWLQVPALPPGSGLVQGPILEVN